MRGQKLLSANGIKSGIKRNTAKSSRSGCGYVLAVPEKYRSSALKILSENGIKKYDHKEGQE